jgi:hypothetical protein
MACDSIMSAMLEVETFRSPVDACEL